MLVINKYLVYVIMVFILLFKFKSRTHSSHIYAFAHRRNSCMLPDVHLACSAGRNVISQIAMACLDTGGRLSGLASLMAHTKPPITNPVADANTYTRIVHISTYVRLSDANTPC